MTACPRVLVIDRQSLFLEAMRSLLAAPPMGAVTTTVTRSDLGCDLAARGGFDLVLCDVLAEPLDGGKVLGLLQLLSPPVPLVLLGELDELVPALRLILEGAAGLFTKDARPEELVTGAAAVLGGHRALSAGVLEAALSQGDGQAAGGSPADLLSRAEREVLALIGQARSVAAIAAARGVSQKTVRNHMASIYRKLELRNRTEAVLLAARMGLVAP